MARTKKVVAQKAQRGLPKSAALSPDEFTKLQAFPLSSETQETTAGRLGVSRASYLRVKLSGTGRFDTIQSIKAVLEDFTIPDPANPLPNFVEQR